MYCKKCRYELQGIESRACPECGRAFDSADPRSFDPILAAPGLCLVVLAAACLVLVLVQVVVLVGPRLVPGWPPALGWLVIALVPVGAFGAGWHAYRRAAIGAYGATCTLFGVARALHLGERAGTGDVLDLPMPLIAGGVIVMAAVFVFASCVAAAAGWRLHVEWKHLVETRKSRFLPSPRTVGLTGLGLFVLFVGWAVVQTLLVMWAEPVISVDYHARLNGLRESLAGVPPEEANAAWAALEPLVFAAPPILAGVPLDAPRGETDDGSVDFLYVLHGPALPADIDREREALEGLRQAGVVDALRAHARGPVGARPRLDPDGALFDEIRGLAEIRRLAKPRTAAMRIALDAGDFDEVAAIFDEVMALARTVSFQGSAIDMLIATAIASMVTAELDRELMEASFPPAICRTLLDTLDRRPLAPIEMMIAGEQALVHDLVQRTYSDDGDGDGYAIPSAPLGARLGVTTPTNVFAGFALAFKSRFLQASRREELALYDATIELSRSEATRPTWEQGDDLTAFERLRARADARFPVASQWLAYPDRLLRHDAIARLDVEGTRALLAIEIFAARHGGPPAALAELVPAILPAVPIDPLSGAPLGYRRLANDAEGRPFLLYSTGTDRIDDGGHFDARMPEKAKGNDADGLDLPLVLPRDDEPYY